MVELPLKQWPFLWSWENGSRSDVCGLKSDNLLERLEIWLLSIRWLHSNDPMTINDRPFQSYMADHLQIEN
ncbi:hypothetical protein [Alcaligenes faecalis]|uniref:hypothetical protein n=1 Tax=Alcaligenes faecalis TaxID=511 RepID=UPI0029322C11|nr:hypothetical protein [Alcaligenes faecalis]MDV2117641.1 hypothetical protein [Alcaligenes faecalis]